MNISAELSKTFGIAFALLYSILATWLQNQLQANLYKIHGVQTGNGAIHSPSFFRFPLLTNIPFIYHKLLSLTK
jgi:hypothetical protein